MGIGEPLFVVILLIFGFLVMALERLEISLGITILALVIYALLSIFLSPSVASTVAIASAAGIPVAVLIGVAVYRTWRIMNPPRHDDEWWSNLPYPGSPKKLGEVERSETRAKTVSLLNSAHKDLAQVIRQQALSRNPQDRAMKQYSGYISARTAVSYLFVVDGGAADPDAASHMRDRSTIGYTWEFNQTACEVELTIDADGHAQLTDSFSRFRYPATPDGWRKLMAEIIGPQKR